ASAEADQRLPISSMVCGTRPGPGEPPVDRRLVVARGTDRAKPPLGPNVPFTSLTPAGWPQARQCMTGANSAPHSRWYIGGNGSACSVTQTASDRKSTRLNSSHLGISYADFCLKKKNW